MIQIEQLFALGFAKFTGLLAIPVVVAEVGVVVQVGCDGCENQANTDLFGTPLAGEVGGRKPCWAGGERRRKACCSG